jgi:hypothetical protein
VNNDVCPRARPLLDFSLFGELPKSRAMFVFGLCFGLLPVLSIYIEPFLYFFVPGWFIFLISQAFPFLLTPRKETFAFVLGLPFIARRQAALRFFNAMQIRLFLCICTAICVYGATHLNLDARAWAYKVAGFGAALLVPAALLYLAVLGTIVSGIIRPSKKDPRQAGLFHLRGAAIKRAVSRFTLRIAQAIAGLLPGPAKILLKRQILYLLRHDVYTFVISWSIAGPATALIAVLVADKGSAVISVSLFALLCLLLFLTTSCLGDSAEKLYGCPYYSFKGTAVLWANLLLASGFCAPFLILGIILMRLHAHGLYLRIALDGGVFLIAVASFCLSIAQLWSSGQKSRTIVATVALSVVCGLLGIMIPWYGILFPLAAIGFFLIIELPRPQQDSL